MISIVLATYNRVKLLPCAIDSVLKQTFGQWELVIVDDGSTDNTQDLLKKYSSDPRIRSFHQSNAGLANARNAGMAKTTGEFITFLDSDDEYSPEHLQLRLDHFDLHPQTGLLHGGVRIVGGPDYVRDVTDPARHIALVDCYIGGTFVIRRKLYETIGGFRPPDYGTDYEYAQRAIDHGFEIGKIESPTYIYHRETPDSLCNLMEKSCG